MLFSVMKSGGFTLVETMIAVTVASIVAGMAVPAVKGNVQRGRRMDAIAALTKIEFAQGRYNANNAGYGDRVEVLGMRTSRSDQGFYALSLDKVSPTGYTAVATASADGPQHDDSPCTTLTLTVRGSQVERGPTAACWNR